MADCHRILLGILQPPNTLRSPHSPGAPSWPNPSQGGQYCRIIPLEEGVAPARRPTICDAPLYAVPLPPYSLDVRFGGSGTAYSKAAHIPGRQAGATPLSLKVYPLCLQKAELVLVAVVGQLVPEYAWRGERRVGGGRGRPLPPHQSSTETLGRARLQIIPLIALSP